MLLSADFLAAVEPLRIPVMGTELMGPLLYSFVRSLRPRHVVEAGMGYTTPFIAQALADNVVDFRSEASRLELKLQRWNEQRQMLLAQGRENELNTLHYECLRSDPALASPSHYCQDYVPIFHAVDSMSNERSSARHVIGVLATLQLLDTVNIHDCEFRAFVDSADRHGPPFDLIWNDADGGGGASFEELFELLHPNGGVMILHDTLTSRGGQEMIRAINTAKATHLSGQFELLSLLEPHKMSQTSATLIRRISDLQVPLSPRTLTAEIEHEVTRFLKCTDDRRASQYRSRHH